MHYKMALELEGRAKDIQNYFGFFKKYLIIKKI